MKDLHSHTRAEETGSENAILSLLCLKEEYHSHKGKNNFEPFKLPA